MKNLNILITAAGGDIGGNIINILSQQKNVKLSIIGTDIKEHIFSIDKLDKFYKIERTNHPDFHKQIMQVIEENNINIIIPVSENEIIWFNANKTFFTNINIMINNIVIIETFLNKFKTSHELNKINIQTPKTYLFSEYNNQLKFPLILKSSYSIQSKEIHIIINQSQLEYMKMSILNHENYIIQEYIGSTDEEYTTAVYRDSTKLEVITFKRKLTGGMTSDAIICHEEILQQYAKTIAINFNLNGSINIQSRKFENQFYIFEINPRFSSTIAIRDYFGFQDLLWWINDISADIFKLQNIHVSTQGRAVLGYQYKYFDK